MTNKDLLARITVDPEVCHGKPCVRGPRYPVEAILEYLAGGDWWWREIEDHTLVEVDRGRGGRLEEAIRAGTGPQNARTLVV